MYKRLAFPFLLLALAVILGAFGAHVIEDKLSPKYFDTYKTANFYHYIHGLGWALSTFLLIQMKSTKLKAVSLLFGLGILLFCGSLYVLSFADYVGMPALKKLGAITPIGGVLFISAWTYMAYLLFKTSNSKV